MQRYRQFIGVVLVTLCLVLILPPQASYSFVSSSPQMLLGNPSGAVTSLRSKNNYLMIKSQYALSYNQDKSIANWVSWELNKSWLGKFDRCRGNTRKDRFNIDGNLPIAISPVLPTDYRGSGFDRGHLIPSGDRSNSRIDNCATFAMTNIIPQTRDINRGPWETLEKYARKLAKNGKQLYIIAGGAGIGGENADGKKVLSFAGYDSALDITVPAICWKIILVLDRPGLGIKDITNQARVIAVAMKQEMGTLDNYWNNKDETGKFRYITTVKEIERLTGYDFFSNLPRTLQIALESKLDSGEDY